MNIFRSTGKVDRAQREEINSRELISKFIKQYKKINQKYIRK